MVPHEWWFPMASQGSSSRGTRGRCLFIALASLLGNACSENARDRGSWHGERETRGDTTIVTTSGGSVWSQAQLVEDLRIGVLEGPDELTFGRVDEIAPDASGGVYVFDGLTPALRYYDASGNYVRTLGGRGSGPGEYRDVALGLAVRRDGRIVLRDPRNSRLNVYHPDGRSSDHWPVASGLYTGNALVVDTADHMYLKILLEQPRRNEPWKIGLLHLAADGRLIDSIPPPAVVDEPTGGGGTFVPTKEWALSPLGDIIVGVPRDYTFEIRRANGKVTRVVKTYEPVQLSPEERAEHEAANEWTRTHEGDVLTSDLPPIPWVKPAYSSIETGADGRIWIRRHVNAEKREVAGQARGEGPPPRTWIEPAVYDVFEPDGVYLGEVRLPRRTSIHWLGRDHLWGVVRGDMDEAYVVRLRLQTR
jgi:hypothetical protein